MDWQLVASYFTVKSTDFFTVYIEAEHRKKLLVKLTNTWSDCLQKRMFLKTNWLSISHFDYLFLSVQGNGFGGSNSISFQFGSRASGGQLFKEKNFFFCVSVALVAFAISDGYLP